MKSYHTLSDEELIVLTKADDQDAFSILYSRHKLALYTHTYQKTGDLEQAKDLIQELFTNLWDRRFALPQIINIQAYLHTILRNRLLDYFAHSKVENKYLDSLQEFINKGHCSTDQYIVEAEFTAYIQRTVNALPPKMREVYTMSRNTPKSHREIAEELGISESTVKNHIKAALKIIRGKLNRLLTFLFFI
ncbi:RNA polymerase sigma factor [Sphingobacterium spiritivorum]|uniref:RNA polymerase sigma-70 factor n=1 Tax=Sphingobacterium spiritivorum ATCC 33861 TaxID=525373 RepID=D7VJZ9_SPHSI|nr:RNA polymerase sigma-70 factor [Sphingobacterium spiritivorum]EFK58601.1 RNA polymerase sigma-70 factor [Sphingobacterium spiritivorum ATCC 33861]QQT34493.1 RNA polymerase sigma-70 factor [Sphingobacterium spiritivorum]WQD35352.1 RNA polymerase sigma-70 factor [Sphingobacterium spiritivorum]SUJ00185.1 Probable RNA polymerase sigma factor fecI [Sphingobacterium spiritivorum]